MMNDLYIRYDLEVEDFKVEQKNCMREYYENRCHFETRVPAIERFCLEKEKCLNKNPEKIGISSFLLAKISGQFFMSFFEQFDWKSLVFFSCLYMMYVFFSVTVVMNINKFYIRTVILILFAISIWRKQKNYSN